MARLEEATGGPGESRSSGEHDDSGSSLEDGDDCFGSLSGGVLEIVRLIRNDHFEATCQEVFLELREREVKELRGKE
jgi:hypothetical protein